MGVLSGEKRERDRYTHGVFWKTIDRDSKAEVQTAFDLFKGGAEGPITFKDLKRVAGELNESDKVTDDQLRDMISEASSSHLANGVDL